MTQCRNNGIKFNPKKIAFCVNLGVLLGHIVCEDGLLIDPRKVNIIMDTPTLMSVIEIKRFLKVTCFYRQHFRNFAIKATPMCKLLKDTHYWLDETYEESFQWMKKTWQTYYWCGRSIIGCFFCY
jgi:hypothetical protein